MVSRQQPQSANLTPDQMRQGISRIQRRISELENFDSSGLTQRWSGEVKAMETAIEETLSKVFGHGSIEYNRYKLAKDLDHGPLIIGHVSPPWEAQKFFNDGRSRSISLLQQAIRGLEEDLDVDPNSSPSVAFTTSSDVTSVLYGIHPTIVEKCGSLYRDAQYAEAVEKGFKIVRDRLRHLTGYETGSDAFGKGKLWIHGAAAPNVAEDFNQAVKFLTMAIDMFRNEKSHTSDAQIDDAVRAHQYLSLSSLALYLLENTELRPGA